jgi:putative transcriptional regulator
MTSLKGHLLVASPHLGDSNFSHTVVLMVQHDADGALGLVLNRPSGRLIRDVWKDLTGRDSESDSPIFIGGPLEGPLMAVHTLQRCADNEIVPGLWFATHRDHLHEIVDDTVHPYRLFSGYSGWGEGQLDGEMKAGGWLTIPATARHVFADDDEYLWQQVTHQIGYDILKSDRHIKHVPDDPSMN